MTSNFASYSLHCCCGQNSETVHSRTYQNSAIQSLFEYIETLKKIRNINLKSLFFILGFSLAASYQQQGHGIARSQWMGALFFSLASPIGVLIGWALIAQRSSPALLMAIAVLQGLACGTFFFVVFCEMLPHEFGENEEMDIKDRFGKIAFLILEKLLNLVLHVHLRQLFIYSCD
ncbi:unnamed protein product, partial [Hymenolepis diminuta]